MLCVTDSSKYWLLRLTVKIQSPKHRVCLKYFDRFPDWIPHTKNEGENALINVFPQTVFEVHPQQSMDLHPLFFFYLWENLNPLVHSAQFENKETVRQIILYAFQTVRKRLGTFEGVRKSKFRCVHVCGDMVGQHSEHILWFATW